jgi:guanylate kinase
MKKGSLIIVSAPSGCGKDTVLSKLLSKDSSFCYSVSATTRSKRDDEIDGVSYFFVTRDAFESFIKDGKLIEHTLYCGEYYGTPKAFVEKALEEGKNVVLKIEVEGMMNVKKKYPDSLSVFIAPPDMETLKRRLFSRGTESIEVAEQRYKRALEEMEYAPRYDRIVYNYDDRADEAACEIIKIVNEYNNKRCC